MKLLGMILGESSVPFVSYLYDYNHCRLICSLAIEPLNPLFSPNFPELDSSSVVDPQLVKSVFSNYSRSNLKNSEDKLLAISGLE